MDINQQFPPVNTPPVQTGFNQQPPLQPVQGQQMPVQGQPVPAQGGNPSFQSGGMPGNNSMKDFFNNVSAADVIVFGLTVFAFCTIIAYYRTRIKESKEEKEDLQEQINVVASNVKKAMGDDYED